MTHPEYPSRIWLPACFRSWNYPLPEGYVKETSCGEPSGRPEGLSGDKLGKHEELFENPDFFKIAGGCRMHHLGF